MLRRAGKDQPGVLATRWAMSYLRGPMTRDQIEQMMDGAKVDAEVAAAPAASSAVAGQPTPVPGAAPAAPELGDDESAVMPDVADGTPVRWADVASPWLAEVGGDSRGTRLAATAVARVTLRYDETKADLVRDDEFECVLPLPEQIDASQMVKVDYDDRDLRTTAPDPAIYRLTDAKLENKTFWTSVNKAIRDELVRTSTVEISMNKELKLYGRPGEDADAFERRCLKFADGKADEQTAKLRDKYETKAKRLEEQKKSKRNSELLSTAGSVLGGLLGGRKSLGGLLGKAGTAARRRGTSNAAAERVEAAENKLERLTVDLEELESDLAEEVMDIDAEWMSTAKEITTMEVGLEASDVKVVQLSLTWVPVD